MTAWLLGPRFDDDFPAVRERLSDPESSEPIKVLWLQTFTVNFLEALGNAGEQDQNNADH